MEELQIRAGNQPPNVMMHPFLQKIVETMMVVNNDCENHGILKNVFYKRDI